MHGTTHCQSNTQPSLTMCNHPLFDLLETATSTQVSKTAGGTFGITCATVLDVLSSRPSLSKGILSDENCFRTVTHVSFIHTSTPLP
jgi:hypothetical protein